MAPAVASGVRPLASGSGSEPFNWRVSPWADSPAGGWIVTGRPQDAVIRCAAADSVRGTADTSVMLQAGTLLVFSLTVRGCGLTHWLSSHVTGGASATWWVCSAVSLWRVMPAAS